MFLWHPWTGGCTAGSSHPKTSDHVVLIPEMHRKNCELKDVEGRTWIWHAGRIGTLGPRWGWICGGTCENTGEEENLELVRPWLKAHILHQLGEGMLWNHVKPDASQISLAFWFISRYVSLSLRLKQPVALKIQNMIEGVFLTLNQMGGVDQDIMISN